MAKLYKHSKAFFLLSTIFFICGANDPNDLIFKSKKIEYSGKEHQQLSARGEVEVKSNNQKLITDHLLYDKQTQTIYADGLLDLYLDHNYHIQASKGKLDKTLTTGELTDFHLIFPDKSLLYSKEAKKINQDQYTLNQASYTSCPFCPGTKPKWNLRAKKVQIDQAKEDITYHNLFFEVRGVPVFFTPYFSHPTPHAKAKSGILRPSIGSNTLFGAMISLPFYYRAGDNKDLTYSPIFSSKKGIIHNLEMRYLNNYSFNKLVGSFNIDKRLNYRNRYSLALNNDSKLNDFWQYGLSLKRTSDQTYIHEYNLGKEEFLTSELFVNYNHLHNDLSVKALSFQNLRDVQSLQGLPSHGLNETPLILPIIKSHLEKQLNYNNIKLALDTSFLSLYQNNFPATERNKYSNIHRFSSKVSAALPLLTNGGHKLLFTSSLRGDLFWYPNTPQGKQLSRAIPQLEAEWRYPLVKSLSSQQIIVEPITQVIMSPASNLNNNIRNVDSNYMDLNEVNLFSDSSFSGLDLVEIGPRVNYGVKTSLYNLQNQYIYLLIGQKYRSNYQSKQPKEHFSDYVGNIGWNKGDDTSLSYKFNVDKDKFYINYSEMEFIKKFTKLWLKSHYVNYKSPLDIEEKRYKELFMELGVNLVPQWKFSVNGRYNLAAKKVIGDRELVATEAKLTYIDDCYTISASASKDYTVLSNLKPVTSFWLNIGLKNIN